jgi:hypothetical protein
MKTLKFTAEGFSCMVTLPEEDIKWLIEQLKAKYVDLTWEVK